MSTNNGNLDRRDIVKRILGGQDDILVVTGLGGAGYDCTAARGDHDLNFCMHGAMGGAPIVALGMAIAQPTRRVITVLGDGDMLMGLGSLATIMTKKPENLAVVVLDNGHYVETGNQLTASGYGVDLAGMAKAAGFPIAFDLADPSEVDERVQEIQKAKGPVFACVKISSDQPPTVPKTRDASYMKLRFRKSLLGVVPT
jgi:thiamine pyrophosphate-dependent acetolactate synthase large subunit-like protein